MTEKGAPDFPRSKQLMDQAPLAFLISSGFQPAASRDSKSSFDLRYVGLARSLTASPCWDMLSKAVLVIRPAPTPLLGIVGYFTEEERVRVNALMRQIEFSGRHPLYISYSQAQHLSRRLARRLSRTLGASAVCECRFTAIPRGGLIVLGMLSYALDLSAPQLETFPGDTRPLVVVDDCSISGARFRQFLRQSRAEQVIFAHLYSHPRLRSAILEAEECVQHCLSACDLRDFAPEILGDDYADWQRRWEMRCDDQYWAGLCEHLCFAWSEPDVSFWNPVTERVEGSWRVAPAELCLKNRAANTRFMKRVQIQASGRGSLRPSGRILFGKIDGQIVIADAQTNQTVVLDGVSAEIWNYLLKGLPEGEVVKRLLQDYETDEETLRSDYRELLDQLLSRGILEAARLQ